MSGEKNILYIGGFELPDKNAAAQRVISNGKLFSKLGYNVIYIGIDKQVKKSDTKCIENKIDDFYYSFKRQAYPTSVLFWFKFLISIKFIRRVIEEDLKGNVDIVIAYNYPAFLLWRLNHFCKKRNIKLIADVTEWYQPQGNFVFRLVKGMDTFFRMKILQKKIDGVITISIYLQNYYKNTNSILLPPLIDKKDKKWYKIHDTDRGYCKIVYAGSPGNGQKDRLDTIILSLSRIKQDVREFKFKIIGIALQEYISYYGDDSLPGNIKDEISFEGRMSHNEALDSIKKADYSIFLRDNNKVNTAGFPTKFVESLACGTPVLTNRTSNINQYLVEGELGYFIDDSSNLAIDNSLIKAINQDEEQISNMKKACFNYLGFDYNLYENEVISFLKK